MSAVPVPGTQFVVGDTIYFAYLTAARKGVIRSCIVNAQGVGVEVVSDDSNAYLLPPHKLHARASTACAEAFGVDERVERAERAKRSLWMRLLREAERIEGPARRGLIDTSLLQIAINAVRAVL